MAKVKIVLNSAGVKELLNSPEIQGMIMEKGQSIASVANAIKQDPKAEYHAVHVATEGRDIVRVSAANRAGVRDNLACNTLLKAKDSI